MKFSIYSELQYWGGKTPGRMYQEVMEQVVHADRLGYDCYAIIEHPFFPKFSISTNPFAFWAACAERTKRINFRTLGHVLPLHNPAMLVSQIAAADILFEGRYELGLVRGHGWHPGKAGIPIEETREIYDEALEVILRGLSQERVSYEGAHFKIEDAHIVPRPISDRFRIFLGGTSDKTYELAGQHGWGVTVPPLLPYEAMQRQLDIYRETCSAHGHEPYIVWIHACYLDEDRDAALREAERGMLQFLEGNASPLTGVDRLPPADVLERSGYGFYASGILEQLAQTPYEDMVKGDLVWVGTPADVIERIEAVRDVCEGLAEISITVNPGGFAHWQAIKAQELFADAVMPHFKQAEVGAGSTAG
jgi:alkanesulfonate monooxygenase SsuD/methylene tetrahydromethanopterin reductase-like flavin-dependent oxidoreductase (luciferase family)